jgi:hypothetical protein
MTELKDLSTQELREELRRREAVAKLQRNEKRSAGHLFVVENIDLLLTLAPEHSRSSCSDDNPLNHDGGGGDGRMYRCERCQLLRIKQETWNDRYVARLILSREELEQ